MAQGKPGQFEQTHLLPVVAANLLHMLGRSCQHTGKQARQHVLQLRKRYLHGLVEHLFEGLLEERPRGRVAGPQGTSAL